MDITGPLRIGVLQSAGASGWELHVSFRDEFRALDLERQGQEFRRYLAALAADIAALPEGDRNRQGMLLVQQLAEQLREYVESGELALNETIKVQVEQGLAVSSLGELLNTLP
jgi:hypothetical protein